MFNSTENEGMNEGYEKKESSIDVGGGGGGTFEPLDDKKKHEASWPLGCADPGCRGSILIFI